MADLNIQLEPSTQPLPHNLQQLAAILSPQIKRMSNAGNIFHVGVLEA